MILELGGKIVMDYGLVNICGYWLGALTEYYNCSDLVID
jgi:hypothetical protein